MTELSEPHVLFESLGIDIPDYVKKDGSKASQPFSTSSHDLVRPETLAAKGDGGDDRTDYFKRHLVRMRNTLGRPVPYRFRDARGRKRSMDAGCLKFVGPDVQNVAEFVLQSGYIVAVEPKSALLAEYAEHSGVANDIRDIQNDTTIRETTRRQQLIDARIGQGAFRNRVLELWNNRCALTGCDLLAVIRASHIVPWSEATNDERLDRNNGLPLVATIDALFEAGLISFDDTGAVLFARKLGAEHRELISGREKLLRPLSPATRSYLARHRQNHGFVLK